jgi:diguanylate cyclase (GGDEF)-like protein/PAS domain S-box-containing protein
MGQGALLDSIVDWNALALGQPLPDVLEHLPDALVLADSESRVSYMNPAAMRLLGMPLEKIHGHELAKVLVLLDGVTRQPVRLCDFFNRNTPFDGAFHLLARSGGGMIPVQCSVAQAPAGHIVTLRNVSCLQQYIDKLVTQTRHDEHTRLLRRVELIKRLWRLLQETDSGEPHALLYLDLDNFKALNDTAGHAAGDMAIRQIATRFKSVVRDRDTLARLGGDEFGLLLERCPAEHARQRAEQLHRVVDAYTLQWNNETYRLGVSIGLALFKTRNHSLNTILAAGDAACYQAKRNGSAKLHIQEIQLD